MRIAGGDSSGGEGFSSSLAASLLRRRGAAGGVDVVGFACGEEGEEGFYGVGGEWREDGAIVGEVEEVVKRNLKGLELLTWGDVADWQQHGSELIHTGYRTACYSIWGCLHSWSYLHNETVNIYSHIVGAVLFLVLLPAWIITTTIPPRFATATTEDILVCGTWLFGVGICFVLSTVFHTLMSHSHSLYHLGMKLDFQGIILLMWGATVPLIYYSFPCHTLIQATYYTATATLAVLCSITTLWPRFSGPHVGHLRAGLFASFGFGSFLVPIVHGIVMYGLEEQSKRISLGWIMMLVACNGIGVVVYTVKFPEKWFPRTFDIFGASHQVMHVMVVFAALSYTVAILQAFDFRHGHGVMLCV